MTLVQETPTTDVQKPEDSEILWVSIQLIDRPGKTGAVLQTAWLLIN